MGSQIGPIGECLAAISTTKWLLEKMPHFIPPLSSNSLNNEPAPCDFVNGPWEAMGARRVCHKWSIYDGPDGSANAWKERALTRRLDHRRNTVWEKMRNYNLFHSNLPFLHVDCLMADGFVCVWTNWNWLRSFSHIPDKHIWAERRSHPQWTMKWAEGVVAALPPICLPVYWFLFH
jgi:hypothetical protein